MQRRQNSRLPHLKDQRESPHGKTYAWPARSSWFNARDATVPQAKRGISLRPPLKSHHPAWSEKSLHDRTQTSPSSVPSEMLKFHLDVGKLEGRGESAHRTAAPPNAQLRAPPAPLLPLLMRAQGLGEREGPGSPVLRGWGVISFGRRGIFSTPSCPESFC